MRESFDTIVVGAGIAGLGVASILAAEAGEKVLVLDRYDRPGGRLMSFPDTPGKGWKVDVGLHMTELGDASSIHELNRRVGVDVAWGPFSETVQFYHEGQFVNIAELVPMSGDERRAFVSTLRLIAEMEDAEIAAWDDRSLAEWLAENVPSEAVRELFTDMGMIMTTIPEAIDMAAGEVLYIGRDNLRKKSQLLTSSYPIGGMEAFTRGLVKVIEDNWGRVETGREVCEVIVSGGRARGVRVAKSGGEGPYPGYYALPELEELDQHPCSTIESPYGYMNTVQPANPHVHGHRAPRPGSSTRPAAVVDQHQPLCFGIGEGKRSSSAVAAPALIPHSELPQTPGPVLQRLLSRHPQSGCRDGSEAPRGPSRVGPVEKGHFRAGTADLVSVEEVIGGDIVLVHGFLHEAQTQHLRVETDVHRRVARDRGQVVKPVDFHAAPPQSMYRQRSAACSASMASPRRRSASQPASPSCLRAGSRAFAYSPESPFRNR